jgi:glutaredoxin
VIVYTRAECPLCAEAAEFLCRQQAHHGFEVQWINVDENAELRAAHGDWVPVIEIDGQVRFRGKINPVLWERLILAIGKSSARTEPEA